ncbi:PadR family transcriptional regulator [Streptacidiphilus sp. PB12-B1b]|uniref:PadR family transcriptional regulator n=1 Tax=Streptacidiphilus sp. PB12-B1b TaxID=2705012 RepID=UPI0015FBA9E1|nr:PadR family transcriptional regulator [Streptacidiphilus sp. PB12-B1b]QMU74698.1 PadR family transcriptional regulator [Streptacidiphilus sp. PB12-B1b]
MPRPNLPEPALVLLIALADATLDGQSLMDEIDTVPGSTAFVSTSTLYGFLDRLVGRGLVRVAHQETVRGRIHRRFCLTDLGSDTLRAESERLRTLATEAEQRLARARRDAPCPPPEHCVPRDSC